MIGTEIGWINALAVLFSAMGGWGIGGFLFVLVLVPVLVTILVTRSNRELRDEIKEDRDESQQRFEQVVRMYEDNVKLVEGYEKVADELSTVIRLNVQAMTRLVDRLDGNKGGH